ncbi:transposable element gene [Prunus dulcis]|uniref:Transposable element protein n=1 Tax=Prunus dulcis TaxID=3755 RepID=A0A5H2XJV0_PRUDU|nr:transposable element gene [Prunus dulcis]
MGRVFLSRHVLFDEGTFPFAHPALTSLRQGVLSDSGTESTLSFNFPITKPDLVYPEPIAAPNDLVPSPSPQITHPIPSQPPSSSPLSQDRGRDTSTFSAPVQELVVIHESSPSTVPLEAATSSIPPLITNIHADTTTTSTETAISTQPVRHQMTRSQTGTLKPSSRYALHLQVDSTNVEPSCFSKAIKRTEWRTAMATEFSALQRCGTWTLVPFQYHMNVLPNKWVFKIKRHSDGSIERYKARLVANGFHQQEGLDYSETFSPVVKHTTIRMVLGLAVSNKWLVRQLDVQNAFLHGFLTEDVYMRQPAGFVDSQYPNHVCKLQRHLEPGLNGSVIFYYNLGFKNDDILVTGNNSSQVMMLIQRLGKLFSMKDLGRLNYFLGIEATYEGSALHLTQKKYASDLLTRTGFADCKPISTPCISGQKLSLHGGEPLVDPSEYRQVVGALQYLTITRPDLSYAVNQVCQFMHSPTTLHWQAVKRILRYLKATYDHGLRYKPGKLELNAYSDADYAGDPDTRHSTGGFCVYFGSNLISWSSKKQKTVSRSSTEAEYRQLAYTAAELSWLRSLFRDLCVFLPTPTLWCDNVSSIALASNPVFHSRTKHLEVDYHYVREKVIRDRDLSLSRGRSRSRSQDRDLNHRQIRGRGRGHHWSGVRVIVRVGTGVVVVIVKVTKIGS